ncbi:MAG: aminotransferase class IV family protein [Sedimentisphaerales bacterium]|nr:aminotransferase class IV family protein [Sedimentisphaerales bacterium]
MNDLVYFNNALQSAEKVSLSVYDAGFLQGVGLFETMRSYNGRVFRLDDHIDRMLTSAEKLGLRTGYEKNYIKEAVAQVLQANELSDALIRITCTSGSTRNLEENAQGTLLVTAENMSADPKASYELAVMVVVSPYKFNLTDPLLGHQSTSNFARLVALQQAQQHKASESLWFTHNNRLAAGCMSDIFLVEQGILYSPNLENASVAPVTRKVVLELAEELGIEHKSTEIVIKDLLSAAEVFLANSVMELIPVGQIEKHIVSDGRPGMIYRQLHEQYRKTTQNQ